jgi:hypothetical protein
MKRILLLMTLLQLIDLHAYGTSVGVTKEWDERGRGRQQQTTQTTTNSPKTTEKQASKATDKQAAEPENKDSEQQFDEKYYRW